MHLFKNAGSSIDKILQDSFGTAWVNWDKPKGQPGKILPNEMEKFIDDNPHLKAISSHDFNPPLPIGNFKVYPILFLRHPILRAKSSYMFEWKKQLGLSEPKGSFADYISEKIRPGKPSVIGNFQANKLAHRFYSQQKSAKLLREDEILNRSKSFIQTLPYFGIVEEFQQSLVRLHYFLSGAFTGAKITNQLVNSTQDIHDSIDGRLEQIKNELGQDVYKYLLKNNKLDLDLYEFSSSLFFSIANTR